jgi:hypothetical protein
MQIANYVCDNCGYSYHGCGGLDFWMNADGLQTVSCVQCKSLQDVPLGNFYEILTMRGPESEQAMKDQLAALTFACKVEPWHTVRPWAGDEDRNWSVPGTIIAVCPRCGGRMGQRGGLIIIG